MTDSLARSLPRSALQLWRLLSPHARRAALTLLVLTLIGTALETLGIGIVAPTIVVLTTPEGAGKIPFASFVSDAFGHGNRGLVVACMVALVAVYAVKAVFLAFLAARQSAFAYGVQANISDRLFMGYLRQPWTFHLERNSAQLLRNLTSEVSNLNNVTQSFLSAWTEGFVLLGITALLVVAEPLGTSLVAGALGLAAWTFQRSTRARVDRWGNARQQHEGLRLLHMQQGLGGVKDIKVLGRETDFYDQYSVHNEGTRRVGQRQLMIQQLPRLWMELLAVTGMAALVLFMIGRGQPFGSLLPILGLFAAAAFRMMPSVIRVMNSFQVIRYYLPVVGMLSDELALVETAPPPGGAILGPLRDRIALDGVSFRYPNADALALDNVTLSIERGSAVGFVGGSGAGKSTLIDVVLGLLTPTEGRVTVDGTDIRGNLRAWQDQVGYVPQAIFLTDDTLRRNIAFGIPEDQIDEGALERAVAAARLGEFVRSLPSGLQTLVGERGEQISGGQRQRVAIARALYHDPEVLVFDEATSSLDEATEQAVVEAIHALHGRKTVVIVAHRMSTIAHCDRLFRLDHGRLEVEAVATGVRR